MSLRKKDNNILKKCFWKYNIFLTLGNKNKTVVMKNLVLKSVLWIWLHSIEQCIGQKLGHSHKCMMMSSIIHFSRIEWLIIFNVNIQKPLWSIVGVAPGI